MCGGFVGKIFDETVKVAKDATVGVLTGGASLAPTPDIPSAAAIPTPGELQSQAATKAKESETKRRRSILTGGRPSTNIAGRQQAQLEQQRKTLLGQ